MRSIKSHDKVLLAKWLWRFRAESENLWRRVVVARFGEKLHWESNEVRVRHGCGLWKSISSLRDLF